MNIKDYNRFVKSQRFRVGDIIRYTHPADKTHASHRALSKQYGNRYYRVVTADPIHASIESMNSDDVFSIFQWGDFKIVMLEEYLSHVESSLSNWSPAGKADSHASPLDFED